MFKIFKRNHDSGTRDVDVVPEPVTIHPATKDRILRKLHRLHRLFLAYRESRQQNYIDEIAQIKNELRAMGITPPDSEGGIVDLIRKTESSD